ncbi:MAG: hypothetical protein JXR97_01520 [Planctomycetes bacterium]|nr:hypothetical protein [Planctomycetota bacterium]
MSVDMCFTPERQAFFKRFYWLVFGFCLVASILSWSLFPDYRGEFVDEDGMVENFSAIFSLCAFFVGFAAICFRLRGMLLLIHLPIPFLSLLAFLDEVSFGIPYFLNKKEIHVFGYGVDGVHDIIALNFKLIVASESVVVYVISSIVIGGFAGLAIAKRRLYMPWIMQQVRTFPAFDFVRYAVILIGVAMIIDLDVIKYPPIYMLEELFEAMGTLALLFACLTMLFPGSSGLCRNMPQSS